MKITMKDFVIFVIGAGAGGSLTWLFVKEEYAKISAEEIESMKDFYEKKSSGVRAVKTKPPLEEVFSEKTKTDYRNIVSQYEKTAGPTEDPPEAPYYDNKEYFDNMKRYSEPYVIDVESYSNENLNHEKITIGYYAEDDTLVDENEDIITDVDAVVGGEALVSFGVQSDDPDIVYVRNERLGIDYEVVRVFKSYQETVLGIVENGPPQVRRRSDDE